MKVHNLLKVYEEQLENLNELKEAALNKQKSIISNKRELIEKFSAREESAMNRISRKEMERANILQSLFGNVLQGYDLFKSGSDEITSLLKQVAEDKELSDISELRTRIKLVTEEIKGVNVQNRFLIEQANSIVKQTLAIVLKSQKKPIVDRRI